MKENEFKGKVAVVTGAVSGMGLKTSQEFVRLGATVVMCDLDEARLRQEVSRLRSCEVEKCGGMAIACVGDVRTSSPAPTMSSTADVSACTGPTFRRPLEWRD